MSSVSILKKITLTIVLCLVFQVPQTNSFAASSVNLFDKGTVTNGYFVNEFTGELNVNSNYIASDYIPVDPSTNYTQSLGLYMAFYDINKKYVSGIAASSPWFSPRMFTTPATAKYIRVSLTSAYLDSYKVEIGNTTTPLSSNNTGTELILPNKIYALEGQELNIYFDNIMNDKDSEYDFDVVCSIGGQYENYFRVTPTTTGTYPITIKAFQNGVEKATTASKIVVSGSNAGSGFNKKILIIGDSTTANGLALTKLNENFNNDVMDITLIGTKGLDPNKHEAAAGWTVNQFYTDISSPFVFNGTFNFGQYQSTNALPIPDYVIINLGINDVFAYQDDTSLNDKINTMLTQYQGMIDSIKAYSPSTKIGLSITIPPAYDQDSFGKMYGNEYTRWRAKRNNFLWSKALITRFKDKETGGVYLIPINASIDTRYNYGLEELPVNARNPMVKKQSTIANGHVHPDISGYWQTMDIYRYFLKSFEN